MRCLTVRDAAGAIGFAGDECASRMNLQVAPRSSPPTRGAVRICRGWMRVRDESARGAEVVDPYAGCGMDSPGIGAQ